MHDFNRIAGHLQDILLSAKVVPMEKASTYSYVLVAIHPLIHAISPRHGGCDEIIASYEQTTAPKGCSLRYQSNDKMIIEQLNGGLHRVRFSRKTGIWMTTF
jgi:hypothetical protein